MEPQNMQLGLGNKMAEYKKNSRVLIKLTKKNNLMSMYIILLKKF
jgi:hypothetical protein